MFAFSELLTLRVPCIPSLPLSPAADWHPALRKSARNSRPPSTNHLTAPIKSMLSVNMHSCGRALPRSTIALRNGQAAALLPGSYRPRFRRSTDKIGAYSCPRSGIAVAGATGRALITG